MAEKEIYIKVDYDTNGVPTGMWHYDTKFINRLYTMRELYNDYVAAGRDLTAIATGSTAMERQQVRNLHSPPLTIFERYCPASADNIS